MIDNIPGLLLCYILLFLKVELRTTIQPDSLVTLEGTGHCKSNLCYCIPNCKNRNIDTHNLEILEALNKCKTFNELQMLSSAAFPERIIRIQEAYNSI